MAIIVPPSPALHLPREHGKRALTWSDVPIIPMLFLITIIFIIVLSFLYLRTFNTLASQGVIINNLEQERGKLILENEVWNMRISRLKSLDIIHEQPVVKQMVNVDPKEVQFISIPLQKPEQRTARAHEPSAPPSD